MPNNIVALIPARFSSERFPGKVLHPILGKAMIDHVYQRVVESGLVSQTIVVTDDQRIFRHCRQQDMEVMLSSACHPSGTDRIAEAAQKLDAEWVINVQGDEPLIDPEHLSLLIEGLSQGYPIATIAIPNREAADFVNPDIVKVVRRADGLALYFSRASIPAYREDSSSVEFLQHMGLYAFQRQVLIELSQLPPSSLETREKLEQLRWVEAGHSIYVGLSHKRTIGVDRIEDVARVEAALTSA